MTNCKIVTIHGKGESTRHYVYMAFDYKTGKKHKQVAASDTLKGAEEFAERNEISVYMYEEVTVSNGTVYCPEKGLHRHNLSGLVD